jgi:uncharacterized surface protein with fasciclin (FAS1) repeats
MKRIHTGTKLGVRLLLTLTLVLTVLSSCREDYFYDEILPEWLGGSIYEYLQEEGEYTTYIKLIDDLGYTEVLNLTGSKTLFVANDAAFAEFYKNNEWGVKKYEDFSLAQKKLIFNFSMINNAYLIETLSNYYDGSVYNEGTAMRRPTALQAIDSIAYEQGNKLSVGKYFNSRREKGIYLLKDNTIMPTAYFTQRFLSRRGITNEDMDYITGAVFQGKQARENGDVHIFDTKVIKRDIVCKNGYVHVLEKVLIPPANMAARIEVNPQTRIFSKLLERFAAPYYDQEINARYRELNPSFSDSIFVKRYFSQRGGTTVAPGSSVTVSSMLPFNPGWNSYSTGGAAALPGDMAAMFVPTDEAMNAYFNGGVGELLKSRFGSWDSVPDNIIIPLLKRHMRPSLIESVPSRFSKIVDDENYPVPVQKSHIVGSYTGVNGQIFYTNQVYPPVDYISVYSPVLLSANTKIMNWAIRISSSSVDGTLFEFYKLYLNSLVSRYSVFIPTDDYFEHYVDPIAYGQDVPAVLKFKYVERTNSVMAYVHKYDKVNDLVEPDPIDSISSTTASNFIKNRLWDVLDSHIVIGDITASKKYYVTKANDIIRVEGNEPNMTVSGGRNINMGTSSKVTRVFNQANGKTFFINNSIQPSLRSLYTTLASNPEFSEFFDMLSNVPSDYVAQIFYPQGVDYAVKFFNAYRYTVYVPTNEAIRAAVSSGKVTPWEAINEMPTGAARTAAIEKVVRFLRYHFQDNTVFFGDNVNSQYQSATIKTNDVKTHWNTARNKYYKIGVVGSANSMELTTENNKKASVTSLNNIIAKDYLFAKLPTAYKNVDGTGPLSGSNFNTSLISTSSSVVVHQINNILTFED